MLQAANEGTCVWCGYGNITIKVVPPSTCVRLPRDLGELQREGRRPDPQCENVVHLERLRSRESTDAPESLAA